MWPALSRSASAAESALATGLAAESRASREAESANAGAIEAETARAMEAEAENSHEIEEMQSVLSYEENSVKLETAEGSTSSVEVGEDRVRITGGTGTTYVDVDDDGLTLGNSAGESVQIHGVEDGSSRHDAVNVQQLGRGVATSNAMQVLLPDPGKRFRLNLGAGYYMGETALGLTGSGRISDRVGFYFGIGGDTDFEELSGKAGISIQW